jgi:hypothetical protein
VLQPGGDNVISSFAGQQTSVSVRNTDSPISTSTNNLLSADQVTAPYTHYRQDSTYNLDTGKIHLPLGVANPSQYGSGGTGNPPTGSGASSSGEGLSSQSTDSPLNGGQGAANPVQPPSGPVNSQYLSGPPQQQSLGAPQQNQATSAIVQLFAPLCQRAVRVEAERVGLQPRFPTPSDLTVTDPNSNNTVSYQLLGMKYLGQSYDLTPDGQVIFRGSAEYLFALDGMPNVNGFGLPIGLTPWANQNLLPYQVAGSDVFSGGYA